MLKAEPGGVASTMLSCKLLTISRCSAGWIGWILGKLTMPDRIPLPFDLGPQELARADAALFSL